MTSSSFKCSKMRKNMPKIMVFTNISRPGSDWSDSFFPTHAIFTCDSKEALFGRISATPPEKFAGQNSDFQYFWWFCIFWRKQRISVSFWYFHRRPTLQQGIICKQVCTNSTATWFWPKQILMFETSGSKALRNTKNWMVNVWTTTQTTESIFHGWKYMVGTPDTTKCA